MVLLLAQHIAGRRACFSPSASPAAVLLLDQRVAGRRAPARPARRRPPRSSSTSAEHHGVEEQLVRPDPCRAVPMGRSTARRHRPHHHQIRQDGVESEVEVGDGSGWGLGKGEIRRCEMGSRASGEFFYIGIKVDETEEGAQHTSESSCSDGRYGNQGKKKLAQLL
jgi:hypothetical protein